MMKRLAIVLVVLTSVSASIAAAADDQPRTQPAPSALNASRDSRYPAEWWKPVAREGAPAWEILPQDAGPGEVILSKRNELGLLSNFANTPFTFHGKRYPSLEGFWQAMKYPEGPDDPRAKAQSIEWKHTRAEVEEMTGFDAKKAGDLGTENMKKLGIDWVTFEGRRMTYKPRIPGEHYKLIVAAMKEKVQQNPDVQKVLVATGDLVLRPDHDQGPNAAAAWKYFEILTEFRNQLARGEKLDAPRAEFKWTGMRFPCKQSAEDGLNEKQLSKKIGKFISLADAKEYANAVINVERHFPGSTAWATWTVGELKDAAALSEEAHNACLSEFDQLGVDIFLELAPGKQSDVSAVAEEWLAKLKSHRCVRGLSVDLEYYNRVDDATAKAWDAKVKTVNPDYRLMLKHWEQSFMPQTYRGKGDLIFVNTSSEAAIDALDSEFAQWAKHFSPSAVAFQIGYPADEDGMDGKATSGWWNLKNPIKDWGNDILRRIENPTQEIGLLWVCAKSGKSYNSGWNLTRGGEPASSKD